MSNFEKNGQIVSSKILLDTNILLDILVTDRPEHQYAKQLVEHLIEREHQGFICSVSLKDTYYVARKYFPEQAVRAFIRSAIEGFEILPIGSQECIVSITSDEPDFEDGLIRAAAEINHIDFLITRNAAAFANSPVKSMTARQYLSQFAN